MKSDFNFINLGYYVALYPNNDQAEAAWNQIHEHFADCNIPLSAWASIKHQLKDAGYTVRKQRKSKINYIDDDLLAAIAA
jgi:hypothetical protein